MPTHKTISRRDVMDIEYNVRDIGLSGASIYYDCQSIFPERLTLAFIKSAVRYGAKVANHAKVYGFLYSQDGKTIQGVKVLDLLNNKELDIRSRLTINCGGPWADIILNIAERGDAHHHIRRSEGIHIITKKLVYKHAVLIMTPEGRHFFMIPWRGKTLIGTTDKEYIGNPDNYRVKRESIEEFLREINEYFGNKHLCYNDIDFAYGGLRPIVDTEIEDTYKSSRKYEVHDNAMDGFDGLITVEGGKYTTSRNLAANAMNIIEKKMNKRRGRVITDRVYLYGCEIKDISYYLETIKKDNRDFSNITIENLGRNFGTVYKDVLKIARNNKDLAEIVNDDGEILAEVIYAVRYEMARTLTDIIMRRTGLGGLGHPGDYVVKRVAKIAAEELKWNDSRLQKEIAETNTVLCLPGIETEAA